MEIARTSMQPKVPSLRSICGMEIELWEKGEGQTVLFLHPGDGSESSLPFVEALAGSYRVVAPSHPGFGSSGLTDDISTVDDLSYFYLDLLAEMGIEDAIVVGASFGGWIAAEMAVKSTERIGALVLVGATGAKFSDPLTREITDIFEVPPYELGRLYFRDEAKWDLGYSKLTDPEAMRLARNRESFGMFAWSPTLHNRKLKQRLHRIHVPTLLAWGDADAVVTPNYGRKFAAAIPGATFSLISNAGHYAHVEQPDQVIAAIDKLVG